MFVCIGPFSPTIPIAWRTSSICSEDKSTYFPLDSFVNDRFNLIACNNSSASDEETSANWKSISSQFMRLLNSIEMVGSSSGSYTRSLTPSVNCISVSCWSCWTSFNKKWAMDSSPDSVSPFSLYVNGMFSMTLIISCSFWISLKTMSPSFVSSSS